MCPTIIVFVCQCALLHGDTSSLGKAHLFGKPSRLAGIRFDGRRSGGSAVTCRQYATLLLLTEHYLISTAKDHPVCMLASTAYFTKSTENIVIVTSMVLQSAVYNLNVNGCNITCNEHTNPFFFGTVHHSPSSCSSDLDYSTRQRR